MDWTKSTRPLLQPRTATGPLRSLRRTSPLRLAAGPTSRAPRQGLSAKQREERGDQCADYLLTYRESLRYDEDLRRELPIATGVIEGACRHLVNDRVEITGVRWALAGVEAVLKLRSLRSSRELDEYWKYHKTRALERNHSSRNAEDQLLEAT